MTNIHAFLVPRWKIIVSAGLSVAGATLFAIGFPITDDLDPSEGATMVYGLALIAIGILFGALTIRCPVCHSRLLLRNRLPSPFRTGMYFVYLLTATRPMLCPICEDDRRTDTERARMGIRSERDPLIIVGRLVVGGWDFFLSTFQLAILFLIFKLGFYSPLVGGILLATAATMIGITVVWKIRYRRSDE